VTALQGRADALLHKTAGTPADFSLDYSTMPVFPAEPLATCSEDWAAAATTSGNRKCSWE